MKSPTPKKVGDGMTRHDVEALTRLAREHGERLLRLKEAYLQGEFDALKPELLNLIRECIGLPKATVA